MNDLRKRSKGKKGQVPPPLKPLPNMDLIRVVQAQYFDNGPKPGSGKSQHTVTLEVYLEDKIDLYRPTWKRSVNLTTTDQMREWADEKHHEAKITAEDHAMYHETCEAADNHASDPEMQFALVGRIEDRRSHAIYPGQIVMLTRHMDGPTTCYIVDSNAPGERKVIVIDRFLHDQFSVPGSGRRKSFGFFDPTNIHLNKKAEEIALAEGRSLIEVKKELGLVPADWGQ